MISKSSISFVVPALNEQDQIAATVDTIVSASKDAGLDSYDIVLVNDGSIDETPYIMELIAKNNDKVQVLHNEKNLGFGASFLRGAEIAHGEYVMVVAGDNAASNSSITNTIAHLGEADIILPYISNPEIRPLIRQIGSRAFTTLINLIFGLKIKYYLGAVFRLKLLKSISMSSTGYGFGAEIVVKLIKSGCSYVQVGIMHQLCSHNRSAALKPKNLLNVVKLIIKLSREIKSGRS